jgi:glycosyltransferase involved in cell wall biosynthesis
MTPEFTIDVIIPTYNEASRLYAALESVVKQSIFSNVVKIMVMDDGSNAEIVDEIKTYTSLSPKIEILLHDRISNPGQLRSLAIQKSNSQFIAFLDADDTWADTRLEVELEHIKNHKCKAVSANATVVRDTKATPYFVDVIQKSYGTLDLLQKNVVITSTLLIETALLKTIGNFASDYNVRGVEDYATWLRVSTISNVCFLDVSVANYTISPLGLSGSAKQHNRFHAFTDFIDWTINSNLISDKVKCEILFEIQNQLKKIPVKQNLLHRKLKQLKNYFLNFYKYR